MSDGRYRWSLLREVDVRVYTMLQAPRVAVWKSVAGRGNAPHLHRFSVAADLGRSRFGKLPTTTVGPGSFFAWPHSRIRVL